MRKAEDRALQAAADKAHRTGTPVLVDSLTTETEQVVARPSGGFALVSDTLPVRARVKGRWVKVDTSLASHADGTLSPKVTAYGSLRLSGGGDRTLVTTASHGNSLTLTWPTTLPKPLIRKSQATYRSVLPGTDLVVTATPGGGFSEVLVVKNRSAAADPRLAKLTLGMAVRGGRMHRGPDGAMSVEAAASVLTMSGAQQWDSNTDLAAVPLFGRAKGASTAGVVPDASDVHHAGLAARQKALHIDVTSTSLAILPDRQLLRDPKTRFPVYVDPTFNWHPAAGSKPAFDEVKQGSPCNHVSLYNDTSSAGDNGNLAVGVNAWSGCEGIDRTYYQFGLPSVIWDSTISTATVNATEVYSATCASTAYTINLHWAGAITSRTNWNNQPSRNGSLNATRDFGPAFNSNCPNNSAPSGSFDVKSAISTAAGHHYKQFTAVLTNDSAEKSKNSTSFKRFANNPTLQIMFNHTPSTPAVAGMVAKNVSTSIACDTVSPYPYVGKVVTGSPLTLRAKISDRDKDLLRATFKYWINGSSTTATVQSADSLSSGSTATASIPTSFTNALTNGQIVDWQVTVTDGQATSAASQTCKFIAQPIAPQDPLIASADGKYPSSEDGTLGSTAGTSGSFTITNQGSTPSTKFAYRLDIPPATTSVPSSQLATVVSGKATVTLTPLSAGPHTLWAYAIDAAGDISAYSSYSFIAQKHGNKVCASWTACLNNTAISPNATPSLGALDGNASISAEDLTAAGWTSGGKVTVNGATFTLPTFGSGAKDNILASNQTVPLSAAVPQAGLSSVTFLGFTSRPRNVRSSANSTGRGTATAPYVPAGTLTASTYCFDGDNPDDFCLPQGSINFTDGTSHSFDMPMPDWLKGPAGIAALTLPHYNQPAGQSSAQQPRIFALSVPLSDADKGKTIASVTLPDGSDQVADKVTEGLHILGMSFRNTTTAGAPSGTTWTGGWANPAERAYNFLWADANGVVPNYSNQTFRVALKPSISGTALRIKLENWRGSAPLKIGHATVAIANGFLTSGNPSPKPTSAGFTTLTFNGGAAGTTVPIGGMVWSDPLPYTVKANQYLLVSYQLTNSVPTLPEHSWANTATEYASQPGTGDHTSDPDSSLDLFVHNGYYGWHTDVLTEVDVATAGIPTLAVVGDGIIDAGPGDGESTGGSSVRVSDVLSQAEPSAPAPFGAVSAGIKANELMRDDPRSVVVRGHTYTAGGPSLLSRIDRDILALPGLDTVVVNQGVADVLHGKTASTLVTTGYTEMLSYIQGRHIDVMMYGLTPCKGYAGEGASGTATYDPCTDTVDDERGAVNGWLSQWDNPFPSDVSAYYYLDSDAAVGIPDSTTGRSALDPNASYSDHVNLNNAGYAALGTAYLGATDTWQLNDGDPWTTASDSSSDTRNPFLTGAGANPLTLNATGATWATDATKGTVLALDGASGSASVPAPSIDTSKGFSLSAWVKATDLAADRSVAAQNGTAGVAYRLEYVKADNAWEFVTTSADSTTATVYTVKASTAPVAGAWTHLVATYNPVGRAASIYVNGVKAGSATVAAPWKATGPFVLGRASGWFSGQLTNVQSWNYALTPTQVDALYKNIR